MSRFFKRVITACLLIAGLSSASLSVAANTPIRVIKETAIPFTAFLSKASFDQRFPGKELTETSLLSRGWYVIYEHESLSYYFGPILLESTGQDYLTELRGIVEAAVDQRPSIQNYRLELSFEPKATVEENTAESPDSLEQPSRTQPNNATPPAKPSIFDFFKRLFGFG